MINIPPFSKGHEHAYSENLLIEKVFATRVWAILGGILFLLFAIVDNYALTNQESRENILLIRGSVILVHFLLFLSTIKVDFFKNYYQPIILFGVFYDGAALCLMIYISTSSDYSYDLYFAGLMLLIAAIFSWTYLQLKLSVLVSFVFITAYVILKIVMQGEGWEKDVALLITSVFFLIGIAVISAFAQLIRDKYLRHNFLLQQSLQGALKEKIIESNDYEYQANHDALTLLPNRRYMTQLLEESLQVAKEKDKIFAILFFDLNGFKQLNDVYGHAVGDEVLTIVAKRLELAIRKGDCISRLGGDEYLVGLLFDRDHASDVHTMAAKFTAIISEPMNINGNIFKVGASVGIAAYPLHGNNVNVLIDIADKKMYNIKKGMQKVAKDRKRNKEPEAVVIFPGNSKSRR
jgi:diguanylate cyclase (GGDEF)-like protein